MNILMLMMMLQLQTPQPSSEPPASETGQRAVDLYNQGDYQQAGQIFQELFQRMPNNGRIAYNLAASLFQTGNFGASDSLLAGIGDEVSEDTLASAQTLNALAAAISGEDYGGVQSSVNSLRRMLSDGTSSASERTGLEAGINWLDNHEPPDDQQNNQNQDQNNQNNQDQNNQDNQDQNNQDNQDQNNQDNQDQDNQDNQDQNNQDNQDQNNQDNQDQDNGQAPPPSVDQMSPEQAQAILDLVQEGQPEDSTGVGKLGAPAGPVW